MKDIEKESSVRTTTWPEMAAAAMAAMVSRSEDRLQKECLEKPLDFQGQRPNEGQPTNSNGLLRLIL